MKRQIENNLSQISSENLQVIAEFVEFVKQKQEQTQGKSDAIGSNHPHTATCRRNLEIMRSEFGFPWRRFMEHLYPRSRS